MNRKIIILALVLGVALTGCDDKQTANQTERATVARNQKRLVVAQPPPEFNWSQIRQNLIDIQQAQGQTTATTTFFFNQGVVNPVKSCASIGFPIPATYQLTNPEAMATKYQSPYTLPQQDTTGVFSGDTSATYVICLDDSGKGRITYWEGFVQTETGEARWDREQGLIVSVGKSSAQVNTEGER